MCHPTMQFAIHQFAEMLKAIADYVGQQYMHGGDIWYMIKNLRYYNFTRAVNQDNGENQFELEYSGRSNWIYIGREGEFIPTTRWNCTVRDSLLSLAWNASGISTIQIRLW